MVLEDELRDSPPPPPSCSIFNAASRMAKGRPYVRSSEHDWQQFFCREHVRQTLVLRGFPRDEPFCARSGCHRNTVKGRVHILHSAPYFSLVIRMYGLAPRHCVHTAGTSVSSHVILLVSDLVACMVMVLQKFILKISINSDIYKSAFRYILG